jgi:hypothetical protein
MEVEGNMRKVVWLILAAFGPITAGHCEEKSLGNWDMSRVIWYRDHPDQTTERLKLCVEHNRGDSECGAAMQACNDLLKDDPQAACQSPMSH